MRLRSRVSEGGDFSLYPRCVNQHIRIKQAIRSAHVLKHRSHPRAFTPRQLVDIVADAKMR
jgi:hypothetical protein